jgi:hypothetical protein
LPPSTAGIDIMEEILFKSSDRGKRASSEVWRFGSCTWVVWVARSSHADAKLESDMMGIRREGRG